MFTSECFFCNHELFLGWYSTRQKHYCIPHPMHFPHFYVLCPIFFSHFFRTTSQHFIKNALPNVLKKRMTLTLSYSNPKRNTAQPLCVLHDAYGFSIFKNLNRVMLLFEGFGRGESPFRTTEYPFTSTHTSQPFKTKA